MAITHWCKDLFDDLQDNDVICHVVNNGGHWGAGFTGPLGSHFPGVRDHYLEFYEGYILGDTQLYFAEKSTLGNGIAIANMFAQDGLRSPQNDWMPFCDWAFVSSMSIVLRYFANEYAESSVKRRFVMPRVGCGLGGASWLQVEKMIRLVHFTTQDDIHVYTLPSDRDKFPEPSCGYENVSY